jgi:hypothetical protein
MKKIFTFIIMLAILAACSTSEVSAEKPFLEKRLSSKYVSMFVQIENGFTWDVCYHRDTRVMYVVSKGQYNKGEFTLMVDAEGEPLLYEGD